jgi:hypothetical protein
MEFSPVAAVYDRRAFRFPATVIDRRYRSCHNSIAKAAAKAHVI